MCVAFKVGELPLKPAEDTGAAMLVEGAAASGASEFSGMSARGWRGVPGCCGAAAVSSSLSESLPDSLMSALLSSPAPSCSAV